jgi:hypothetical protein
MMWPACRSANVEHERDREYDARASGDAEHHPPLH